MQALRPSESRASDVVGAHRSAPFTAHQGGQAFQAQSFKLLLSQVPAHAEADERLLGHIFTNLLSNAVKYLEPGATVHFTVERDGPDAVCTVRDQGIGIAEEDQQRLFEAFHRGSNVGARPGTGLGLLLSPIVSPPLSVGRMAVSIFETPQIQTNYEIIRSI